VNEHPLPTVKRILCSVDLDLNDAAFQWSVAMAEHFDAALDVLHVRDNASWPEQSKYSSRENHAGELLNSLDRHRRLEQLLQGARPSMEVTTYAAKGPASAAILERAKSMVADLVVLSSRQGAGSPSAENEHEEPQKKLVDVVAERLPCAVLAVSTVGSVPAFNRILLPVDFSESTKSAVAWTAALAGRFSATVQLVHVITNYGSRLAIVDSERDQAHDAAVLDSADGRLSDIEAKFRSVGVKVESKTLSRNDPARAIVEECAGFDLIVMGMHEPTPSQQLEANGTIANVRAGTNLPLLSVRATGPDHGFARGGRADEEGTPEGQRDSWGWAS
jgi:nucleotide-binding universal stress UspA family protein